jgi:hypothetical protein
MAASRAAFASAEDLASADLKSTRAETAGDPAEAGARAPWAEAAADACAPRAETAGDPAEAGARASWAEAAEDPGGAVGGATAPWDRGFFARAGDDAGTDGPAVAGGAAGAAGAAATERGTCALAAATAASASATAATSDRAGPEAVAGARVDKPADSVGVRAQGRKGDGERTGGRTRPRTPRRPRPATRHQVSKARL